MFTQMTPHNGLIPMGMAMEITQVEQILTPVQTKMAFPNMIEEVVKMEMPMVGLMEMRIGPTLLMSAYLNK
jgi:hypothetical protein